MNTVNVIITVTLIVLAVMLNQAFKGRASVKRQSGFEKTLIGVSPK